MTTIAEDLSTAAGLIYEAKSKEFSAACWAGTPHHAEECRRALHDALDGVLDTTWAMIAGHKAKRGSPR
jgi:hypothetical protein